MAVGFTTFQSYRYVIPPMAYRIIFPPLDQRVDEHLQELRSGVRSVHPVLAQFYLQAGEERAQVEMFVGVTALYIVSAMAVNRIMTYFEKKLRIPDLRGRCGTGGH